MSDPKPKAKRRTEFDRQYDRMNRLKTAVRDMYWWTKRLRETFEQWLDRRSKFITSDDYKRAARWVKDYVSGYDGALYEERERNDLVSMRRFLGSLTWMTADELDDFIKANPDRSYSEISEWGTAWKHDLTKMFTTYKPGSKPCEPSTSTSSDAITDGSSEPTPATAEPHKPGNTTE